MTLSPAPNQSATLTVLAAFLAQILPPGVEVIQAQGNRVPEPAGTDFVVMTPLRRGRLETNVDDYIDTAFSGSIAGAVLTVGTVAFGSIAAGDPVYGTGVITGTTVLAQLSGTAGGAGTYAIDAAQNVPVQSMAAGIAEILQPVDLEVQLDVHGPGSADNAQIISTLFRDDYACEFFAAQSAEIAPLYADDPRQLPFVNDQNQYENRWVVAAHLQVNATVTVGQQFAAALAAGIISVEATYPP